MGQGGSSGVLENPVYSSRGLHRRPSQPQSVGKTLSALFDRDTVQREDSSAHRQLLLSEPMGAIK